MAYLFGVSPTFLYFCRQIMRRHILLYIFLLPCVLLLGTLSSCRDSYPKELVQADSLLLRGEYHDVDSLLAVYDANASSRKSVQMYRHLLGLERHFVRGTLSSNDFSVADSLCRYYDGQDNRKSALSQLFLGNIYMIGGDYPLALECYLKAEQGADALNDLTLQTWVNRRQGDVYFNQHMLPECIDYYKKSYSSALQKHDTLRLAHASCNMGRVYMIKSDVDSILFYYHQAIELAKGLPQRDKTDITTTAKTVLADIYTQIEEYDKAKALMTRESIDNMNWAYWHLAQHHTDSAYWYFSHIIENKPWKIKVEYLPILAKLEEERGNREHTLMLYKDLVAAKDSLQAHSQVEETRKVKFLHEFNQIKQERDDAQRQSTIRGLAAGIIFLLAVLAALVAIFAWLHYRKQKERELAQERLLRQEEERKSRQSAEQIAKNQQQMILLRQQLQEAQSSNDVVRSERLQSETRLLDTENRRIQASLQHRRLMQDELEQSPLREHIKQNAGKEQFHLTDEEWLQLAMLIDAADDQFTNRLRNLYDGITEYELHICYLVKLDIPSVAIGTMLYKSKAAIGMARQRLYKKLTGKSGTAKQFNDFIQTF